MAECIILAGGKSTRMKTNKMLLDYKGRPLIWHTIKTFEGLVSKIIVVTGKYDKEIRDALKNEKVSYVYNKDYELGMFSSVLTGVKEAKEDFFVMPGDCPFVKTETIKKLIEASGDIRVPSYRGEDGHPIYISKKYKDELLTLPLDYNLKLFRDSKKYEIINVEDKNIVINLNSILDYQDIDANWGMEIVWKLMNTTVHLH